jgi:predicted ribosomally synthesized peptide with nif11-like leader
MTEAELRSFIEKLKSDSALHEKIGQARDAKSFAAVAAEAGFDISADWLDMERAKLSEAELEGIGVRGTTTFISQPCRPSCGITWDNC